MWSYLDYEQVILPTYLVWWIISSNIGRNWTIHREQKKINDKNTRNRQTDILQVQKQTLNGISDDSRNLAKIWTIV